MKEYFPFFVNINHKKVRVFGGGKIAARRVKVLLEYGADVHVVAPEITEELKELAAQQKQLTLSFRRYRPSELTDEDFVLAATDDEEVNTVIFRECRHKEIFVNTASDKEKCDFYFPGIVQLGEVTVGVTAGGINHRKAAQVTERIRELLSEGEGA